MRKRVLNIFVLWLCLFFGSTVSAQIQAITDVDNLLSDALWYADRFITPATDAAVYQASSAWVRTPQKRKLWDVDVSLHTNVFFVPKANRKFAISDNDFKFFKIEEGTSATVPTGLGNDEQIYLVGYIDTGVSQEKVHLKTPEGIDMENVIYPYLQASIGFWHGLEMSAKYSTHVKLKNGHYQVYGGGFRYNLSQYLKKMEVQQIYLSAFAGYSREEISFDFLKGDDEQYEVLGLNELSGLVDTWQFQVNASKKWGSFELMGGAITNVSTIKYEIEGTSQTLAFLIPVQSYINSRLSEIYKTKINSIGELSGRYQFGHFYAQAVVAVGKFANTNVSIQYQL